MPAIINSIGMLKNSGSETHLYNIKMSGSDSDGNWFATFVSNTPITNLTEFLNFMVGKSKLGVAGGGFKNTTQRRIYMSSGYLENNYIQFYGVIYEKSTGSYSSGLYSYASFSIDSNTEFKSIKIY